MASTDGNEYVIAPWRTSDDDEHGDCDVEILTVDLPSRDITVQLEVPVFMLDRTEEISRDHGIPVETVLAERLEINRSRVEIMSAQNTTDTARIREHLEDARGYLSGVEHLDTASLENKIAVVWMHELDD